MKRLAFLFLLCAVLVSCGTRSGHFKVEGRFMHLNQGELYVYSPDGVISGFDTIHIEAGRFAYEIPCTEPGELILVFPNFSEHPIFASSGGTATVKADASHLKEMEVKGTDENKLMTQFRSMTAQVSPPEEARLATQFIEDHPASRVSVYLLRKFFLKDPTANRTEGTRLADLMLKEQPKNGALITLRQQLQTLSRSATGHKLPAFKATDIDGTTVTGAELAKADMAVVMVWSSWNFPSREQLRMVSEAMKSSPELKAVGICVDAEERECRLTMQGYDISLPVVWDGLMLDSPLLQQLGLCTVPGSLIVRKGRITERNLSQQALRERLKPYTNK